MLGDVAYPITLGKDNREEFLLIYFDGFIKNTSEGIVRTMLRDEEDWITRYPNLSEFSEMEQDEVYENTMIFTPLDLLYALSDGKLSEEEMQQDLEQILPIVFLHNSRITSFEYALYNLMQESFIKQVYLYREEDYGFYENEIEYVNTQYAEVSDKIHFIHGGIVSAIQEYKPTTLFTTDYQSVKYLYSDEVHFEEMEFDCEKFMVILLNTNQIVQYDEKEGTLNYDPEFLEFMQTVNRTNKFSLAPMYNVIGETEDMEEMVRQEYEDDIEEEQESEEDEDE